MKNVVIISATHRENSYTLKVSDQYAAIVQSLGAKAEIFDLRLLPDDLAGYDMFGRRSEKFAKLIEKYISQHNNFIFVIPEYNGSYPGILKLFLDAISPREWWEKKACLVGVSDGRAGNLRGMEHLTGVLQYLKMDVFHNKLPISLIARVLNEEGRFSEDQMKACTVQVRGFLDKI